MPRHRTDPHMTVAPLDPGQRLDAVEVDQVGTRGEAEAHGREQAHAAGERTAVLTRGELGLGVVERGTAGGR